MVFEAVDNESPAVDLFVHLLLFNILCTLVPKNEYVTTVITSHVFDEKESTAAAIGRTQPRMNVATANTATNQTQAF